MTADRLRLVGDPPPQYPFAADLRLTSHYFTTFHHRRYLTSRLYLMAAPEVRCFALEMFFVAQDQTPIGTLPLDQAEQAALLRVDLAVWQELCARSFPPTYQWTPCQCGSHVRLMHPVVIEMIEDAIQHQRRHHERSKQASQAMRFKRVQEAVLKLGVGQRLANDPLAIEWIDQWMLDHCEGRRIATRYMEALDAWSAHSGEQIMRRH